MPRAQRIDDVSCAICMDPLFNKLNDLDEVCHTAAPNCGESLVHLLLSVHVPVAEALLPVTPSHSLRLSICRATRSDGARGR